MVKSRPVQVFMLLVILVLLLPSVTIPSWYKMTKNIEHGMKENRQQLITSLISQIDRTAQMLHPLNSSAFRLATLLTASRNDSGSNELSFSEIQTKVAPAMFNTLLLVPHVTQISYVGIGGLFFSYYIDSNQNLAVVYSNSTKRYNCYTQIVSPKTGILYGEPTTLKSSPHNPTQTKWFHEALNSQTGYASLEAAINNGSESVFHNAASVHSRKGVVGLGYSSDELVGLFKSIDFLGGNLTLAAADVKVLAGDKPLLNKSSADHYSSINILGVTLVYALTFPLKWSSTHLVHKKSRVALILLILTVAVMLISILSFLFLLIRAAKIETNLRASYIKQTEATQKAERKNLNKTLAFASASHDIRNSLIAIDAAIDLSRNVSSPSELKSNLDQMKRCTKELEGLLTSVLDMSKIEAGKMQLDVQEFDVAQLVEDAVDLHYQGGVTKGVDIIFDLCDGSVLKFSKVKGDKGKLIQILNNLLSNAVKFTTEGHITVRAWARKYKPVKVPSMLDDSNSNCGWSSFLEWFNYLFGNQNNSKREDMESVNDETQSKINVMEFIFEVDDTGKGIPKENQEYVFENYFQVKETALGVGGTGLGLGIVQSLVRLLGGDIRIIDKEAGKGTCFRFSVFFTVFGTCFDDIFGSGEESRSGTFNLAIRSPVDTLSVRSSSPRSNIFSRKPEGSYVVLLMRDEERQRVLHKFMEHLGISVCVVNQWESLTSTLHEIISNWNPTHSIGSSGNNEIVAGSLSNSSSGHSKENPLRSMDGTDHKVKLSRRKGRSSSFLVLVIDVAAGPLMELQNAVGNFQTGLQSVSYKIIWLNKPTSGIDLEKYDLREEVLVKPLHGLTLYHLVIKHLPEFGGLALQRSISKAEKYNRTSSSSYADKQADLSTGVINPPPRALKLYQGEIEEVESSENEAPKFSLMKARDVFEIGQPSEIQELFDLPLYGKRILVADDSQLIRQLVGQMISKLVGATVDLCENGEKAVNLVRKSLEDQKPYDYILMDCQMPIMNGYEATSLIREAEKFYRVHIPIIACTAGSLSGDEADKFVECGMDDYIPKPLQVNKLMDSIRKVDQKLQIN
ncbi:hypothetical protein ACFE04_017946 [Oxalis oulophora]